MDAKEFASHSSRVDLEDLREAMRLSTHEGSKNIFVSFLVNFFRTTKRPGGCLDSDEKIEEFVASLSDSELRKELIRALKGMVYLGLLGLESMTITAYLSRKDARKSVAKKSASAKLVLDRDGKFLAMQEIRLEFNRWQNRQSKYENDAHFARVMHATHASAIRNEGSIKNAIRKWRRAPKASG